MDLHFTDCLRTDSIRELRARYLRGQHTHGAVALGHGWARGIRPAAVAELRRYPGHHAVF